jgi:hypothetical protein
MQPKKTPLPENLLKVCAGIVSLVHEGKPLPNDYQAELCAWLEDDGWDSLIAVDEGYAVKLYEIAEYRFRDSELALDLGLANLDEITDLQRVAYARHWVQEAAAGDDGYLAPTVHCFPLYDHRGREAIFGVTVEIHGQAGAVPIWHGVFKNLDEFFSDLRSSGYWLASELPFLEDSTLMASWIKEKRKRK